MRSSRDQPELGASATAAACRWGRGVLNMLLEPPRERMTDPRKEGGISHRNKEMLAEP